MSRNGFGILFRTGAVTARGCVSGFYPLLNSLLGGDFGGAVPQAVGEMGLPTVSRGRYGLPPVRKIERETKRRYAMKKFNEIGDPNDAKLPLSAKNYVLLLVGAAVILLGMILMSGGGSDSPDEFNYAMFSWRRITLAPILVIGGFAFEIYAILKRW